MALYLESQPIQNSGFLRDFAYQPRVGSDNHSETVHPRERIMWRMIGFNFVALWMASAALAEPPPPMFRAAFVCPDKGSPTSICIYGTLLQDKKVTLVTSDRVIAGTFREEFRDSTISLDTDTFTRVEGGQHLSRDTLVVALLAPAEAVKVVPQVDYPDRATINRIDKYVATKFLDQFKVSCIQANVKCSLNTRLARLSPSVVIAEVHYRSAQAQLFDKVFLVKKQLVDMNREFGVEMGCGELDLAFELFGRLHAVTTNVKCESDAGLYRLIHDLSGPLPKLVFAWDAGV
jgi:hypothetical protein